MSWLRIVASVSVGLLVSACAESAVVQKSNLTHVDAAPVGIHAAKSAGGGSASFGLASYYSYPGRTANGERYDPKQLTAAHRTIPFGTKLQVTNMKSGRSVVVRVNDRGPFIRGRVVDVSYAAARELDLLHAGTAKVRVEVLNQ
jgi:peptidoglycan lytic transglycosylase